MSQVKAERSKLYGPQRSLARDAAKKLLTRDHVKQSLQSGVNRQPSNQLFQSTTAADFKHSKPSSKSCTNVKRQSATHLYFGADSQPCASVTTSDFGEKLLPQSKHVLPDYLTKTNLADFNPEYRVDDKTGGSFYKSDFDGQKTLAMKLASRGDDDGTEIFGSEYHRSAHFDLGNFSDSLVSEARSAYRGKNNWNDPSHSQAGKTRFKSNVFREGDYNVTSPDPTEQFTSTQQRDYLQPPRAAAGVSTVTRRPYSHVLPKQSSDNAVSALRRILIDRNEEEFKNPRDPTTINVVKAFATYDQLKTGRISVEDLKIMCEKLGVPVSNKEMQNLLLECNCDDGGEIDFVKFCEFLTAQKEPPKGPSDFTSTTSASYPKNQNLPEIEESGEDGHRTGTNFVLGYDKGETSTVYKKDFTRSNEALPRPLATGIPCSKVMHEFPVIVGTSSSVNQQDFTRHKLDAGRLKHVRDIAKRYNAVSVDLGSSGRTSQNPPLSETALSFGSPGPRESKRQPLPNVKNYRHLESNEALPHPLQVKTGSEAQNSYTVPFKDQSEYQIKRRESLVNHKAKIQENKATHYVVGFDPPQMQSEQAAQFYDKKPPDRSELAAGKPGLPTKGYSIISHDTGEFGYSTGGDPTYPQQILQQRNFLKNINPRDTANLNLMKAFLEYDKNLSGAISKEDLKAACKNMDVAITDSDLDGIIARCDLKGDGLIDYHEFSLNLSRLHPPKPALLPGIASSPWSTTVTRTDYMHPANQQMTEKQRVVQEKDAKRFEAVEIQPSRLFQWAAQPDYLQTIQRRDFRKPESVLYN